MTRASFKGLCTTLFRCTRRAEDALKFIWCVSSVLKKQKLTSWTDACSSKRSWQEVLKWEIRFGLSQAANFQLMIYVPKTPNSFIITNWFQARLLHGLVRGIRAIVPDTVLTFESAYSSRSHLEYSMIEWACFHAPRTTFTIRYHLPPSCNAQSCLEAVT